MPYEIIYRIFVTDHQMENVLDNVKDGHSGTIGFKSLKKILRNDALNRDGKDKYFTDIEIQIIKNNWGE